MRINFFFHKSPFRQLYDGRERLSGSCAANAEKIKQGYACLGEGINMLKMISDDFGKTEQCNYHVTASHISNLPYALAFRVRCYCYLGKEKTN